MLNIFLKKVFFFFFFFFFFFVFLVLSVYIGRDKILVNLKKFSVDQEK